LKRRALIWIACLGLAFVAPARALVGVEGTAAYLTKYLVVSGDEALIARDGLLGFNYAFGHEAVQLLDEGAPDEFQAAVATLAVGASGLTEELGRLQAGALAGTAIQRRASVLALGELGPPGGKALIGLLDDPELGSLATLALLRSHDVAGRKVLLERFKQSGADPTLLGLIDFVDGPANYTEVPATARILFQLRFEAARAFGLVEGQRWSVHLAKALAEDDAFLDQVVFLSAADSNEASVRDYVLERLVDVGGTVPLTAALRCMHTELLALVESGLYAPASPAEWQLVVSELESRGATVADALLLARAKAEPTTELAALGLLARLGDVASAETLRDHLSDNDPKHRTGAVRGLGGTRDKVWLTELARMQDDPDARVRATALVARLRLGSGVAMEIVRAGVLDPRASVERTELVVALAATSTDPVVVPLLQSARETAIGGERLTIDLALRLNGDLLVGRELLAVLDRPSGLDGRTWLVEAMARHYDRQDLAFFESIFPSERHPSINTEVAVALARGGSPEGIELLRQALWRGPFDRSQLAAVALFERGGLKVLSAELESVPLGASADALRRVGYALGVLGGSDELDRLRRRRGPADPALQGAYLGSLAGRTF